MGYANGCGLRATINGNEPPIKDWSVSVNGRQIMTEDSLSGPFVLTDACGGIQATLTLNVNFDVLNNPFATPFNLRMNQKVTNVKAYINGLTGLYWNFASMVVTGTPMSPSVTQTNPTFASFTLMSDGAFTYPGNIAP